MGPPRGEANDLIYTHKAPEHLVIYLEYSTEERKWK